MTDEEKLTLILDKINKIDQDLSTFKNNTEDKFNSINKRLNEIQERDSTFKQTAKLTVFRNEVNTKLDELKENIDYLTTKEAVNEREIFKIKQKMT